MYGKVNIELIRGDDTDIIFKFLLNGSSHDFTDSTLTLTAKKSKTSASKEFQIQGELQGEGKVLFHFTHINTSTAQELVYDIEETTLDMKIKTWNIGKIKIIQDVNH